MGKKIESLFLLLLLFIIVIPVRSLAMDCTNPQTTWERGQCTGQTFGNSGKTSAQGISNSSATSALPAYSSSGCTSSGCDSSVTQTQYYQNTGSTGTDATSLKNAGNAAIATDPYYQNGTISASCKGVTDFTNKVASSCNQKHQKTFTSSDPIIQNSKTAGKNAVDNSTQSCSTQDICSQWVGTYNTSTCQKSALEYNTSSCSISTVGKLTYQSCQFPQSWMQTSGIVFAGGSTYATWIHIAKNMTACTDNSSTSSLINGSWDMLSSSVFSLPYATNDGVFHYIGSSQISVSSYVNLFYIGGCTQNTVSNTSPNIFDTCSFNFYYTASTSASSAPPSSVVTGYPIGGTLSFQYSPGRNIYTETTTDTCAGLTYDPNAGVCSDFGTDGLGNKTFVNTYGSYSANHACWDTKYTTYAANPNYINTCTTLETTSGCSNTASSCASYDSNGNCTLWDLTWDCSNGQTCAKYTTQTTCVSCTVDAQGNSNCPGTDSTLQYNNSAAFSKTASYLSVVKTLESDWNCSIPATGSNCDTVTSSSTSTCPIKLFPGKNYECRNQIANYMKCCKDDGALWGAQDTCLQGEKDLIAKQEKRLCHYVGEYCASKILFGTCIEKKKSYCCFNSKLSRIIQVQGRAQAKVGKSWGTPEVPDCSGFNMCEFTSIDFSGIDLSEFFEDITTNMVTPSLTPATKGSAQ